MTTDTLVLGVGNVLMRDDAIGAWVAESLRGEFALPPNLDVVEGGTLGLELLPRLEGIERLLLVDAISLGREPGEIVRMEGEEVPRTFALKLSPHQVGVAELLAAGRLIGCEPRSVVLWGMEPERVVAGTGFSRKVAAALPKLLAGVLGELTRWNVACERIRPAAAPWWESAR